MNRYNSQLFIQEDKDFSTDLTPSQWAQIPYLRKTNNRPVASAQIRDNRHQEYSDYLGSEVGHNSHINIKHQLQQ